MTAESLISKFNSLNGQAVQLVQLKDFHAKLQRHIDSVGNGPNISKLKEIHGRITKAIKNMVANHVTLVKAQITPVKSGLNGKKKSKPRKNESVFDYHKRRIAKQNAKMPEAMRNVMNGLEHIQDDAHLKPGSIDGVSDTTYKVITDKILELMKSDGLLWRKPWNENVGGGSSNKRLAHNYVTGHVYRGANFWLNFLRYDTYKSIRYFTFNQVTDLGGKVRKDEEGWPVVYFKLLYKDTKANKLVDEKEALDSNGKIKEGYREIPALFYYKVFNEEQCIGLKIKNPEPVKKPTDKEIIASAEKIIEEMPKRPKIVYDQEEGAFYSPVKDFVNLPSIGKFENEQKFYCTSYHELIHSTGHTSRVDRMANFGKRFGDKKYAFEELIAELGASYLCGESGILYFTLKNSAAYIKNWSKALRDEMEKDPKFFLQAASQAQKATDFMLARGEFHDLKKLKHQNKELVLSGLKDLKGIPETILEQLGANKFIAMTGARGILATQDKRGLIFQIPNRKMTHVKIVLNDSDTYDVEFIRLRGTSVKTVKTVKGVHVEDLRRVFTDVTGLETSLGRPETKKQKKKVHKVIKEFKEKKLKSSGHIVTKRKQAVAIAMHEAKIPRKKKPGTLSGADIANMNFTNLNLTGPWKQDFNKLFTDTQMMFWGPPGGGKTVYVLKLAKYLAADLNLKTLYVAHEELGRSTFTEKIREFDIQHPNLAFAKDLSDIDLDQYQAIILDSVNSLRITLDDYIELHRENPGKLFILVVQSTKDGDFRGGKDWEHEMDFAGEIVERRLIVRKNRNDPEHSAKAKKIMLDNEIKEQKEKTLIRKRVKEELKPEPQPQAV